MRSQQTRHLFQQADVLFRKGEYTEALGLLQRLDKSYPNNHRLLYPMALCLQKLGRYREALSVCDRLAEEFQYKKCEPLRQHLRERLKPAAVPGLEADAAASTPANIDMGGLDSFEMFGESTRRPGPPPLPMESSWSVAPILVWIGGIVGGLAALTLFTYFILPDYRKWDGSLFADSYLESTAAQLNWWQQFLITIVFGTISSTVAGYFGLKIINSLPHDDFSSDIIDVGIFGFFSAFLTNIPLLWLLIMPVAIYKHYDLNFTSMIVLFVLFVVFNFITVLILVLVTIPGTILLQTAFG